MSIKEPMHPGKVLKMIMDEEGHTTVSDVQNHIEFYSRKFAENFLCGNEDIDYLLAYKLGSKIDGTDMVFWLKLQKDYDEYVKQRDRGDDFSWNAPTQIILDERKIRNLESEKPDFPEESDDSSEEGKDYGYCAVHKNVLDDILENILELDNDEHMRIKSDIKKIYDANGWALNAWTGEASFKSKADSPQRHDGVPAIDRRW